MNRLTVDLYDLSRPELVTLTCHWRYAAERLGQELAALRPRHPTAAPAVRNGLLSMQQWAGVARERKYWAALARSVEQAGDRSGWWLGDSREPGQVDLTDLAGSRFVAFVQRELRRAELAVRYVTNQPFDQESRANLLTTLDIEIRFFSAILKQLERAGLEPALYTSDVTPLLFFSLPRPLVAARSKAHS